MKKFTIAIWILVVFAGIRGFSQNAPISTIGTVTSHGITATVPITATNFTNIGSYSLEVSYNPTFVSVSSVTTGPLVGGNLSVSTIQSGIIYLSWYTTPGLTVPDNSVVVNIVFAKIMDGTSTLSFVKNGVSCEWYDGSGSPLNDSPTSTYYIPGSVTFSSLPAPVTTLPVIANCPGTSISVPITVTGFSNIGAVSLTFHYTTSVLTYVSGVNTSGFPGLVIGGSIPGTITIGGFASGVTLPDGSTLVTLSFLCSGTPGNTDLTWDPTGVACQYQDYPGYATLAQDPFSSFYINGSVSVASVGASISGGTSPTCYNTDPGILTATGTGGIGTYTYLWYKNSVSTGITTQTYDPGLLTSSSSFYCAITSGSCGTATTGTTNISVTPTVGTPTAITIFAGVEPSCQLINGSTTTTYATTATTNTGFNWSLSNGAAGVIGATTGIMTWTNGFSGTVNIQVTANGCNGPSAMVTRTVTVTPTVGTPTAITVFAGVEPSCQLTNGSTTTTYATMATNNTGFNWSLSNGAAGSIGATTGIITWTSGFAGTVNIQVTANGCNGPSAMVTRTVTVTPTIGTPTAITVFAGVEPSCQLTNGSTTTTYATTATNNTGFNWSLSNGAAGSIGATTGIMTWTNGFFGTVNIQVTANGCNGPSAMVTRTVTVTPTVGTPTAITVSAGVEPSCQLTNGITTTTYATTATTNTGFNWSLSNGAAGVIGATTGIMTWTNGFSGTVNIQVTANGCNGPSAMVTRTVTVTPTVGTPTAITVFAGVEPSCQLTNGSTTTTYATTATNNTGFNWSLSNGAAGSIGATTGIITWTSGFAGTVNIQVTANGCNGPSAMVTRTVTVTPTVGTPTAITVFAGVEPSCQLTNGSTTTTYATTATNNTGFNWSLSNGAAGSIGATTGIMTWTSGFAGTVNIQVTANGCNGPSAMVTRTVTVTPTVGTPTAITVFAGVEPSCQLTNGITTTTYATTATTNTGFNWSLSNGAAGVIGATTGIMTWANGFSGTVNIQVTANGCNGPSAMVTRTVTVTPTVGTPTAITVFAGVEPSCQLTNGSTTTTYATTATNNTGFNWSLSNGAAGSIGGTTGIMTWANGFSGTVNIQVTANGCNGPSAMVTRTVTVTPTVGSPTAITVFAGVEPSCQLTNGSTTTTYATTATNNTGFNWSLSNGAAGSIGATTGIMTWTSGFAGTVNIQVTANGCNGPSAMVTRTVTVTPTVGTPTAITVFAGVEPSCQLTNGSTTTTYATTATNNTGFNWSLSNGAAGSIGATTGIMTWTSGFSGTVNIQVTANGCNGPSAMVTRTVTVTPTVGTPTAITVSAGVEPSCQLTNGSTTTTYATTATNNTGFNWSLSNGAAGSIGATTGIMTWTNGFFGTVNIQVTANGCNSPSAQVIRTVTILPTASIASVSGTSPLCKGVQSTYLAHTVVLGGGSGSWSSDNTAVATVNASTGLVTTINPGTCNIIYTITGGCNGTTFKQQSLTVNPDASITSVTGTSPLCINSTATYTANGVVPGGGTGLWSSDNIAVATVNASTGLVTGISGGTCNIIYTITGGCNGTPTAQQSLTITPNASIGSISGTTPLCYGATATYTANGVVLGGGTGSWSSDNTSVAAVNASTGLVTAVGPGNCNITYTITGGCLGTSLSKAITVYANLTAIINGGTSPICYNTDPGAFTAAGFGGSGSYTYQWYSSFGIITGATNSTYDPGNILITTGYYCAVSSGSCGPVNTVTTTINVYTQLFTGISGGNSPICYNTAPGTFTATASGSMGLYTYQWHNTNTGLISGATNPTYTPGNLTTTTGFFCAIMSGTCGPVNTNTITITVDGNLTAGISGGASPICYNTNPGILTATGGGGIGTYTYLWYKNGVSTGVTTQTYNPGNLTATTTFYCAITSGSCGTVNTSPTTITVDGNLTASISGGTSPICYNTSPGTFTATGGGGTGSYTYQWYNTNTGLISGATNSTYNPGNITTNTGYYCAITSGSCGTVTSNTIAITVNPLPTPTIAGNASVCLNSTNVYTTQTGSDISNYSWTVVGGSITSGGTATDNTVTITWNAVGSESVSVNYTDINGCTGASPTVYPVTVNALPTAPGITVVNNCNGTATLTATGVTGSLLWSTTQTINPIIVSANGTYTVTQTVLGCTSLPGSATVNLLAHSGTDWYVSTAGNDANIGTITCPFATIQHGITAASSGNIVHVAAGTYTELVTVNKGVTLQGAGSGSTIIKNVTPANENIITVAANNVTLNDFAVEGFVTAAGIGTTGIYFNSTVAYISINNVVSSTHNKALFADRNANVSHLTLNNTDLTHSAYGFFLYDPLIPGTVAKMSNLSITNGSISDNFMWGFGSYIVPGSTGNDNNLTGVTITGTTFNNNALKGLYFETLNNAVLTNITITNSGSTPNTNGTSYLIENAGIDINLKGGTYSNIQVLSSTISGCGIGDPNGGGILVKSRSTGGYSSNPATLTSVVIDNNFISNNGNGAYSAGIRIGESFGSLTGIDPGPTNVAINNNSIQGNSIHAIRNATSSTGNVAATCNWYGTGNGNTILSELYGSVTYSPWLISDGTYPTTGFEPAPSSCSGTQVVIISATPNANCGATTGSINVIWSGGTANYTVSWTGTASGTGTPTSGLSYTITGLTAGNYTITVTDANGSYASTSPVTVTLKPLPTAHNVTGTGSYCAGGTGLAVGLDGSESGINYQLYSGGTTAIGLPVAGTGSAISFGLQTTAGTYTVKATNTTTNCINDMTGSAVITVNPLPTPTISGNTPSCLNSTNTYNTESGMTGYSWLVSAGGSINGSATNNTVSVTWNTTGAQSVSVNYTNTNGCTAASPTVYPVTVNDLPIVSAATLQNSLNPTGPWSAMNGTLAGGYSMCINPAVPFYYLDINTMTVSQSLMANTLNPFTLSQTGLPGGWLAYWAAKGVVSGATGWQGVMWQIINGNAPIFYIYYTGGDYQLIDGLTYQTGGGITPLRVSGDYPQGTYTYNGTATDVNGCVSLPFNVMTIFNTIPVVTAATLQNSLNLTGPWSAMNGTLAGGYSMCINPAAPFYYLDINTMTVSQSLMANTFNPFTLSQTGLPGGWLAYWAAKGVVSGATGWQGVMWQIINGNAPIFYIYYTGGDYQLIDGLTYQTGGGITPLRVSGDYPQGTYTYNGTVTDVNECVSLPFNVMTTFNTIPVPILSGPTPVCLHSTGNIYITESGMTGYSWTVTGGTITSGGLSTDNTVTVTWNTVGTESVSVNYTDIKGCTAASPTAYSITVNTLPVPTISGNTPSCLNSTNAYTTESGMTGYSWMVSAGGSINGSATNNTVSVTWNTAGAQSVSVNYTNTNGCTGASPTIYPVTVNPAPSPTVNGNNGLVCTGSAGNIYYTEAGMTGYTWTVTGGTITAGAGSASITVTWTTSGVQTVNVNYENSYGCYAATPGSKTVIVIPLPTPTISGPSDVCQGSTDTYTTESGMSNYTWSISAGGSITSGAGTHSIIVTWNTTGAKTVSVTYNNTFGCPAAAPTVYPVMVNPLPLPTILGPTSACANSAGTLYVTQGGMNSYLWTVSAGGNITSGAGTDSITVAWNTAGAQTVSVRYTNAFGCTIATPTVRNVTVNALPTPAITGQNQANTGTPYVYTTQSGMTNYLWTVSSGGTITAGGGTGDNTITILWTVTGSQSVSVNYTNSNGCSAASPTVYPVTVSQSLSTISGYITYYNSVNTVMNNVTVTLQGTSYSAVTNSLGYYQILNVPTGTYTMVCTTVKPTTGAINSADAALTNQWSNSQNNGSWPAIQLVKFFSGDVSGNNTIQPNDPSLMLAYFVNSWTTWAGHSPNPRPDWTFWFPGTTTVNNSSAGFYPQITVPANTIVTQNLYGLVTGDFNQSLVPNGAKLTNDYVTLDHGQTVNPDVNGTVELPVYATSPMEVGAVSLILNFPSDKLEIEGITMNSSTNTPLRFNVIDDELRIGWNSMTPINLQAGDKLLTLTVKLIGTLSKDETLRFDLAANPLNELDDANAKPIDNTILSMNVIGSTLGISSPGEGNLLLANYPNPFDESTTIAYTLPKAGEVTLEIRNMLGTVVQTLVSNTLQAAGDYKLKLDNNLIESGMYMATLKLNSDGKVMSHIIKIVCAR